MSECLPNLPRYIRRLPDGSWLGAPGKHGPWRSIPAPQQALPWPADGPAVPESREPASVTPEATGQPRQLSPAAQAVLDAVVLYPPAIAAILRAVADQVVPHEQPQPRHGMRPGGTGAISPYEGAEDQRAATRRKLLGIAAELEGADG